MFHCLRVTSYSHFKSKVGNILTMTPELCITLNIDVTPITSTTHTHPSNSQTSHYFKLMLKQKTSPFHLVPHLRYPLSPAPLTLSNLSPFHLDPHLWYPISPLHPVCERSLDPPVFTDTVYFYVFPVPLILTVKKKKSLDSEDQRCNELQFDDRWLTDCHSLTRSGVIHQTWRDGSRNKCRECYRCSVFFWHICVPVDIFQESTIPFFEYLTGDSECAFDVTPDLHPPVTPIVALVLQISSTVVN
jgi:hypothetical protein